MTVTMDPMLLNCANPTTALESLAGANGSSTAELRAAVASIEAVDLLRSDDPVHALPALTAARLGGEVGGFSEVRYFHGTRTGDPCSFYRRGLLPLATRVEDIWRELSVICVGLLERGALEVLRSEIEAGGAGDGGHQYRLKTQDEMHHGPFGEYVREHFFRPAELNSHDYLGMPELVADIANAASDRFGLDIQPAYVAATRPCIVAFDLPIRRDRRAVTAACWYVWATARGEVTRNACGGFDGHGVAVPPTAIRDAEIVEL